MDIYQNLYEKFKEKSKTLKIKKLIIGISYTGVILSDNSSGLSYTWLDDKQECSWILTTDPEGNYASDFIHFIKSKNSLEKAIGMAIINALNHDYCSSLKNDSKNEGLFSDINIDKNTRISMVGFIKPLFSRLKKKGAEIDCIDIDKKIGNKQSFYENLQSADLLIITSSSIINSGFEKIISRKKNSTKAVLIGPTTPMVTDVFNKSGVSFLAGSQTITKYNDEIFKAIAHGKGTPVLKKYMRKIIAGNL